MEHLDFEVENVVGDLENVGPVENTQHMTPAEIIVHRTEQSALNLYRVTFTTLSGSHDAYKYKIYISAPTLQELGTIIMQTIDNLQQEAFELEREYQRHANDIDDIRDPADDGEEEDHRDDRRDSFLMNIINGYISFEEQFTADLYNPWKYGNIEIESVFLNAGTYEVELYQ
jgi:hypothetical protein